MPLQVYQLYRKSQVQGEIIDAIAKGDPDTRQILELARTNPTSNWVSAQVHEKPEPAEVSYEGLEILSNSRIYDLRHWHPDEESPERRGHVYIRDRIKLKFLESYEGSGIVRFVVPLRMNNLEFRWPNPELPGVISRITGSGDQESVTPPLYEFEYDLSQVLPEEPITIEVELMGDVPKKVRAPFVTHTKTDLISAWMLFPADQPYRTYSLVSYPADKSGHPQIMNSRYQIDHPYGSLIGWSVVNPDKDRVYECRWTTE